MKQPQLGKKVSELRKAINLTQEELAEKCGLNVRTVQRIESCEATPRSHTVKVIFDALGYKEQFSLSQLKTSWDRLLISFEMFFSGFKNFFNLKTNTMKKISVLLAALILLGFWGFNLNGKRKSKPALTLEEVEKSNRNYIAWFNGGKVDSLLTMYGDNACAGVIFCGKEQIKMHFFTELSKRYKFEELKTLSLHCSDTLAVETGTWIIRFEDDTELTGVYMTEWHFNDRDWYIASDIASY